MLALEAEIKELIITTMSLEDIAADDIDAGMVDTDMHATPGLDTERRDQLVPGPGGKPLAPMAPILNQILAVRFIKAQQLYDVLPCNF